MGKYIIQLSKRAFRDLQAVKNSGRKLDMKKLELLFLELELHPKSGTGSPEKLRYYDGEVWSREVNKKDRLVYEIFDEDLLVIVIQSLGHYDDR